MHCEDPGCLRACPADGAIVQYTNGIVDFQQENCIGCQYCVSGCPFDIPKFNPTTKKVYKCTLCSDRVGAGSRAGVHQVVSDRLPALRDEGRHDARSPRRARSSCASTPDFRTPACTIRRRSAARTSSTCCTTSRSRSCTAGFPSNPQIPVDLHAVEAVRETDRPAAGAAGGAGRVLPLRHGRTERAAAADPQERRRDDGASNGSTRRTRRFNGTATSSENELLRHPVYTRVAALGRRDLLRAGAAVRALRSTRRGSFAG